MISPRESASWTASMTLYWNFHIGTSKPSLGDFFCRKFWAKFLLACFGMQDVCTDNCQVEQMKEMFLPPFYHLPFKRIIWQHLVWSVHNTFTLTVAQHCRCFYFMMCPHVDGTPTSISSWALVKTKTSQTSSHLIAKRWFHWGDFFLPFFQFSRKCLFTHFFSLWHYCAYTLCLTGPKMFESLFTGVPSVHVHTLVLPFYFVTQPDDTESHLRWWDVPLSVSQSLNIFIPYLWRFSLIWTWKNIHSWNGHTAASIVSCSSSA